MSEKSLGIRSLTMEFDNGERQELLLDSDSVGKALEIGLIQYVATGPAPSPEIPVGVRVKNNIAGVVDYSQLNPNADAVAQDEEFEVTVPNKSFAAGSQAAFDISEVLPRVVLV